MTAFDWQRMLLDNIPLEFLGEVAARTLLAFVVVFLFLKIAGRRGVRQLSLFELVIILTLGSAAGDMTFYEDVPLLPVLTVFAIMAVCYRLTTALMSRHPRFQAWLEGQPFTLIRDGQFELETLTQGNIAHDEFLMELRQQGVEHLGQVRLGIVEVNGDVSLYFYDPATTRPGLSVLPPSFKALYQCAPYRALYACNHCGGLQPLEPQQHLNCPRCVQDLWSEALHSTRIT
ncbi:MAG: YetF domain-containing protein [Pseudomonadota bacterium]